MRPPPTLQLSSIMGIVRKGEYLLKAGQYGDWWDSFTRACSDGAVESWTAILTAVGEIRPPWLKRQSYGNCVIIYKAFYGLYI